MREERISGPMAMKDKTVGDSAVDGLLAGVGAGLVMAVVMAATGLVQGEPVWTLFRRFAPGEEATALSGLLAHVAVSAVYGLLFALLRRAWPGQRGRLAPVMGLLYGIALYLVAQMVLLRSSMLPLAGLPAGILAAGHIAYGLVLGWLLSRSG